MKFKVNKNYRYFVYNVCEKTIFAGNEYQEDAREVCAEFNEISNKPNIYKVYTAKHIINKLNINPYDFKYWSNLTK